MSSSDAFIRARDFLLAHREDYATAYAGFRWPQLDTFNWALDHFDVMARDNAAPALWVVADDGSEEKLSFAELSARSNRVANFLRAQGVQRGDRVLIMLGNVVPLWETMLAAIKLGAVMIPATTLLTPEDLADRFERGGVRHVVTSAADVAKFDTLGGDYSRIAVGGAPAGWVAFEQAYAAPAQFVADGATRASDPLLLYFTSGTTSKPKLVEHTHASYPVGHLSTMYWIGLQPGDVHWNISSPGWAKHAWSNVFAPWNAGATVFVYSYARFDARRVLDAVVRYGVTTLCAPPTVWRMLIQEDLAAYPVRLRELVGAGEPLNPEVIERVQRAWGITLRDGYGQTETTAQIGNPPGQPLKAGSMGRPLPGYRVELLDPDGRPAAEGEIALALDPRPLGLMAGYRGDAGKTAAVMRDGHYRCGDVASRDADGYLTYVGRADDVFKASDYRISPFELESVLIEHAAVAEAAVVPSPDALRLAVPKAFVILRQGYEPSRALAASIFAFLREHLAPYKRVRRLEFADLPKTISGKIRRVELRKLEEARDPKDARRPLEFWEDDFPELK
ncbi:acetyl-CoA synthetase [Plasticicumulans lactativorans]|uniref:Acetyl-CoA synthetase n=1 Tax=Plasticicumulans lactativorans TaxID=1133106 RepID=A0A4R2L1E1_9GAMM|nr:AMP-binding protein [Plasticicumulans lactativorans]TCO80841.1 acetyl-CoA synthetase [Plasticicumulans lactativorans]